MTAAVGYYGGNIAKSLDRTTARPHVPLILHFGKHDDHIPLRPEIHANRIALDTGAYRTGRLTAAVIRDDALSHFVSTEVDGTGAIHVGEWRP